MRQLQHVCAIAAVLMALATSVTFAAEPVQVDVTPMTFTVEKADHQGRGGGPGYYIKRDTISTVQETVDVVKLNNGLVEAWVCPAYGARLLRAFDVQTKVDYFQTPAVFTDHLSWSAGGVKASFPFFEHGLPLEQRAGYRIVHGADGSVTVAMDMRFYQHTSPDDLQRYGEYSDEALDIFVTVTPGSSVVTWRQRKENPNPLAHSDKLWDVVTFPQERITKTQTVTEKGKQVEKVVADEAAMKTRTEFIYPARWVCDHGPTMVHSSPHWSDLDDWDISHFALYTPYGFGGGYYPQQHINRLRINDTARDKGPGMKLYTAYWPDFFELWGGQGIVFEIPGELRPGYVPNEFTHRFYIAQGIDKVSYANADVAVSVNGNAFAMVATREAQATVTDATGAVVAHGAIGPHTVLKGTFSRKLIATLDGTTVLDQTFPLDLPEPTKANVYKPGVADSTVPNDVKADFQALLDRKSPAKNPTYYEQEGFCANEGAPTMRDGLQVAKTLGAGEDPVRALSIARVAYRLGDLADAERIAKLYPGPEADLVLGLVAWEQGKPVDFGKAGVEANYHRAMLAIQQGDTQAARADLDALIAARPTVYYPRLMRAYLAKDVAAAQALAAENPASPEAQLVLELLGVASAQVEKASLLKDNPEGAAQVARFQDQITRGRWVPVPRYPL